MTDTPKMTGGNLIERATGFGLRAVEVDGSDVELVWKAAKEEINRLRNGGGPIFLLAHCTHLEGHFLGDPLLRYAHHSISETLKMAAPLVKAHTQSRGAPLRERTEGLKEVLNLIRTNVGKYRSNEGDPVSILTKKLTYVDAVKVESIEQQVRFEINSVIEMVVLPAEQMGGQEQ
jgi:TPP-dependent pyruvate/acetoin dehydrogenase alpha subunit